MNVQTCWFKYMLRSLLSAALLFFGLIAAMTMFVNFSSYSVRLAAIRNAPLLMWPTLQHWDSLLDSADDRIDQALLVLKNLRTVMTCNLLRMTCNMLAE